MHAPIITPGYEEFARLALKGNLVPVWCEVLADLETPVSAFLKLRAAGCDDGFLLESVEGGEAYARYSFLGVSARARLQTRGREVTLRDSDGERRFTLEPGRDPLHVIE